jgi:hypothetical protein
MDKIITFVSKGFGARYHDLKHLKHIAYEYKQTIEPGDLILIDAGFVGFQKHPIMRNIPLLVPYKRKKSRELTKQQSQWNYFHAQTQSKIKRVFGKIKHKFAILRNTFRGPSKRHSKIVRCPSIGNFHQFSEI